MQRDIGERIRKMREAQSLSREQVCRMAGLTAERLEAFEEGAAVPSIGVVIKLSRVLGSRMEGLIHGGGTSTQTLTVNRAAQPAGFEYGDTDQGYTYRTLTRPGTPGHFMEPFLLTFDPRGNDARPISHEGQEFVYVVEGAVELFYDGAARTLTVGDSAYLDASKPHLFKGVGSVPARMVAVVCSGG
jgi:transcriptional regulator with XRE-family HTH domain